MAYEVEVMQNKLGGSVGEDGALNIIAKSGDAWAFRIIVDAKPTDAKGWNNDSAILECYFVNAPGRMSFSGNIWSLEEFAEYINEALRIRNATAAPVAIPE
jgi:hypothetical protein